MSPRRALVAVAARRASAAMADAGASSAVRVVAVAELDGRGGGEVVRAL